MDLFAGSWKLDFSILYFTLSQNAIPKYVYLLFIRTFNFGMWMNFLNFLRISVSNVLKMFLNIIVSIEWQLLFSVCINHPKAQIRFIVLATTLAGKTEI